MTCLLGLIPYISCTTSQNGTAAEDQDHLDRDLSDATERITKEMRTNAPTGRVDRNWIESGGQAP